MKAADRRPTLTSILPPLPPQPQAGLLVIFSPAQWRWIGQAFQLIHADNEAVVEALGPLTFALERLMATVQELQTALDANTAATDAAATAITTEITQLQAAIDALSTTTPPSQAQLDQLNAATAKLTAATAALNADDPATPTP